MWAKWQRHFRHAVASLHHHVHCRQHACRDLQLDVWNRFVAGRASCSVDDQVGDATCGQEVGWVIHWCGAEVILPVCRRQVEPHAMLSLVKVRRLVEWYIYCTSNAACVACCYCCSYLPSRVNKQWSFPNKVFCGTYSQDGNTFLSACQGACTRSYCTYVHHMWDLPNWFAIFCRLSLHFSIWCKCNFAFSSLKLLVRRQLEHPACKNCLLRCCCGYLSGARCRLFAYCPADATAIPKPHHLLPPLNPDWFYLSGTGSDLVFSGHVWQIYINSCLVSNFSFLGVQFWT